MAEKGLRNTKSKQVAQDCIKKKNCSQSRARSHFSVIHAYYKDHWTVPEAAVGPHLKLIVLREYLNGYTYKIKNYVKLQLKKKQKQAQF